MNKPWKKQCVYFDFDSTLAEGPYVNPWQCGAPIEKNIQRMRAILDDGRYGVKVFSARFSSTDSLELGAHRRTVMVFLSANIGNRAFAVELTAIKGMDAVEIIDDIAVACEKNTGKLLSKSRVCEELNIE